MTKEGFTKTATFITPGEGVLALGHGHISHRVERHLFSLKIIFSTHKHKSDNLSI